MTPDQIASLRSLVKAYENSDMGSSMYSHERHQLSCALIVSATALLDAVEAISSAWIVIDGKPGTPTPNVDMDVLLATPYGQRTGYFDGYSWWVNEPGENAIGVNSITHWRPLPAAPEIPKPPEVE